MSPRGADSASPDPHAAAFSSHPAQWADGAPPGRGGSAPSRAPAPHTPAAVQRPSNPGATESPAGIPSGILTPWPAVALALVVFANSLSNDFAYDDNTIVRDNPRVRSLSDWRQIWLSDWWRPPPGQSWGSNPLRDRLYRPLTLWTFAVNYAVGGLHPLGYHLVNVLLHAIVCGLVGVLARRLLEDRAAATLAALLFAVHPVHSEAVANVVGRAELLAALFLLIGLLCLLPSRAAQGAPGTPGARGLPAGRTVLAAIAFLAALLSKETAICYPAVAAIMLYWHFRGRSPGLHRWLTTGMLLTIPLAVYFPMRLVALEGHLLREQPADPLFNPLVGADARARLILPLTILGHYTRLLIVPARLSCDYGYRIVDPEQPFEPMTVLGLATAAGMLLALRALVRAHRGPDGDAREPGGADAAGVSARLGVLAAISLASYALISNTFLLIGVSMAERLMYWPSAPLLMMVAVGLVHLWRRHAGRPAGMLYGARGVLGLGGVLLLAALGLRAAVRNMDWANDLELFARDVQSQPRGAHLRACLARELIRLAQQTEPGSPRYFDLVQTADQHLETALTLAPRFADAMELRGYTRGMLGDIAGGIRYLESSSLLAPLKPGAMEYLWRLRGASEGRRQELEAARRAAAEHPQDVQAQRELGRLLLELGHAAEAIGPLESTVQLAPDDAEAWRLLGQALAITQQNQLARQAFLRAVELDPRDWESHANLCTLLSRVDPRAALEHGQRAFALNPSDLRARQNLAEALALNGRTAEAIEHYRRVEQALPRDDPLRAAVADRIRDLERVR